MRFNKKEISALLIKWIKWDADLWAELSEVQLKLLFDRIVGEMSFEELGNSFQVSPSKIKKILNAMFIRIEKSHGQGIANLLRSINAGISAEKKGFQGEDFQFEFGKVFLN